MPASGKKEDFDFDLFRKRVAHFDNTNAGESGNAIRQALKQCADAGMGFIDAVTEAYGANDNSELRQQVTDLENAVAEKEALYLDQKSKNVKLAEVYEKETATSDALREQLATLENSPPPDDDDEHERGLWASPKLRLLLLFLLFTGRVLLQRVQFEDILTKMRLNLLFSVLFFWLFMSWGRLEYRRNGFSYVIVRGAVFLAGLAVVFEMVFGWWPWTGNGMMGFMEVTNVGADYNRHFVFGIVLLVVVALLTLSKLPERLAESFSGGFDMGILRRVRDWF